MSMLPEIAEKFQEAVDDWLTGVKELAQEILGDDADEETVFLQTAYCHATTLIGFTGAYYYPDNTSSDWAKTIYCKCEFYFSDGVSTISSPEYVGRGYNNGNYPTNEEVQLMMGAVNGAMPVVNTAAGYTQACLVGQSGGNYVRITGYNGSYNNDAISLTYGNNAAAHRTQTMTAMVVYVGGVNYTVNNEQIITTTGVSELELCPTSQPIGCIVGIAGYPYVGNMKDITYINDFVNKMVSTGQSTHNYNNTYTTPGGAVIRIYYGDNYTFTYVEDDEPVSYDDIKNAIDIAINQINEDNDTDIHSEPWSPEPPPPTDPDADIEVEMDLNDAAFGEGLSHYYVTTVDAPVLSDISEAMSSWNINNTGKDLYRNLLSCRITKVGPIPAENSTFVIYGEELLHGGSPISINKITGNPSMDLGEYEIKPKFNDFRDYAPYTKIEMFIPYCGWVALPSHVMSSEESPKIITGTLLCDIIAGTCKAVIKCNDTVVAEASGFTAVDVPFTGENVGMKMAGIASAITSYGNSAAKTVGNIASGGMSGGAGAGASAAGGLVGLLGSYAQLHSAFNANYTEICGKTGDGCNVAGLNKVYIKIQRPKTGGYSEPDFVPEDYGHTTGFIAMKKAQISECEGLIVCSNPDTSGIGGATDREREMIKNLLESGIIVRHTEPEP